jgi:hypothetical protein
MSVATTGMEHQAVRAELTRYCLVSGEHIVIADRVHGVLPVTDIPATGTGVAQLVDPGSRGPIPARWPGSSPTISGRIGGLNMVWMR